MISMSARLATLYEAFLKERKGGKGDVRAECA
jgi:hypothetical protein